MAVPKLRFPGFDGEWTQKNLNSILKVNSGRDYKHLDIGDIPVYGTGGYMTSVNEYLSNEDAIGIGRKGSIDKPQKLSAPFWTVDTLFYCTTINSTNLNFLYALFNKINWKSYDESTGVPSLSKKTIDSISIGVPNIAEQEVIGGFFRTIDEKIQLQQQKIDLLKEQKKGFMQKIFSQELRFPGFNEPWRKFKLGDLGSVVMNKRIFKEQTSSSGDIPFYKIGTFGANPDAFISREIFEEYKQKYPFPQIGDILISASGSIGRTVEYKGEEAYFQDSNIVWLKHDERINKSFLKQFYSIVKWKGLEGSTIQRLYNKNILGTEINLPSIEEQEKIGFYFNQLDKSIQINEHKLEILQTQKQAFMQQMFI